MKPYKTIIDSLTVLPEGDPIFSEMATKIYLEDEAAGLFVIVEQNGRTDIGKIQINEEEWPHIRKAIDRMIADCVKLNKENDVKNN